ncbi:MAG: hypothetical protein KDK41_08125 [Leptospiraceae bacterium]|nr:hypothetical protein [Leptospiraceae bacterium]
MRKIACLSLLLSLVVFHCKTAEKKSEQSNEYITARDAYFALPAEKDEVFRIFASSDAYDVKQLSNFETIKLKEDLPGQKSFSEELKKYNLIELVTDGVIRVELYPNSGTFYRIRQGRPSKVVEVDKLMSEDITRFQFIFENNKIEPRDFKVGYGIMLQKDISREEAEKLLRQKITKY